MASETHSTAQSVSADRWKIQSSALELFIKIGLYLQIVKRQKGLWFSSLLFNVLDAISAGFLRVHNNGVHVFSQHFGHSNLVFLLGGLA